LTPQSASGTPPRRWRFILNTSLVLGGKGLTLAASFATTVVLLRLLPMETYGLVMTFVTTMALATTFMDFGSSVALVRFGPHYLALGEEDKVGSVFKEVLLLRLAVAGALVLIAAVAARPAGQMLFHHPQATGLLWLAVLGAVFGAVQLFLITSLQTWQRFIPYTLLTLADSALKFGCILALLLLDIRTLAAVAHVYVWVPLIAAALALIFVPQNFIRARLDRELTRALFHYGKWNMVANFCMLLYGNLDVLMLAWMHDPLAVAVYAGGYKLATVYGVATQSLATVLLPYLSSLPGEAEMFGHLRRVFGKVTLIALASLSLLPFAGALVVAVAGDQYNAAIPVFRLLFLDQVVILWFTPLLMLVYVINRPDMYTVAAVFQLVLNILGNLVFIPRYGALGAAAVTVTVRVLSILLLLVWVYGQHRQGRLAVHKVV